jgi:hypothetical protein
MWELERRGGIKKNGEQGDRANIVIVYVTDVFTDMRRRQA